MSDRIDWWFIHTTADVWAAWGQWAGGIGTTAAVVIALWVALGDRRRRDAERRDNEKRQARQLLVKVVPVGMLLKVTLTNRSDEPLHTLNIQNVRALSPGPRFENSTGWAALDGPRDRLDSPPAELHPGETWTSPALGLFWEGDQEEPAPDIVDCAIVIVDVLYTDARGGLWKRSNGREPQRILLPKLTRRQLRNLDRNLDRISRERADERASRREK